jgi:hypothetical protein
MKRKTLTAYPERTLKVCFKKSLRDFTWAGHTVHGSFESGKCYELPLETGTALITMGVASRVLGSTSVENILKEYSSSDLGRDNFEKHFDRQRILDCLRAKAGSFWTEILGKNTCPNCKKAELRPKIARNRFAIKFSCPGCKKSYKKSVLGSQFPYWIISSTIHGFCQGKTPRRIYRSLKVESTNRYLDFYRLLIGDCGLTLYEKERIPKKSAILDIRKHFSQKLRTFNSFTMLLVGGVECKELLVDDAFIRKSWTAADIEKWKSTPKSQQRKLKSKRFSYMIVFVDKATRFIVNIYTALHRDSLNFNEAFRETKEMIKGSPLALIGDMLAPQVAAAKLTFSEDGVFHDFQVLNIKEKDERNIIERRIRDLRETLPKRQRYSSDEVLEQLASIALVGQNYLNPMAVLDGQTPAQRIGIPYPFDSEKGSECQLSWNWRVFMVWVDWVFDHATEILAAGLK